MSDDRHLVLVTDDEKNIRRTLKMVLDSEGYDVAEAQNIAEAEEVLRGDRRVDAILLDVKLGEDSGIDLLERVKQRGGDFDADIPVLMISGHASIDDAVAATRYGAFDFLEKPLDRTRVTVSVRNALEQRRMALEVRTLRAAADSRFEMLGTSQAMEDVRRQIARVAPTKSRVLITGDSGTGKELIARALHRNSAVSGGPFVKVNCAAIPPELIESELFGHERGAFTGATARKRGLFEVASGGTMFLDEIGDMTMHAQAKVLRVLQTGEFVRVGGETPMTTDARVVAATNKDLAAAVETGEFREDLYFRLNVVPIESPALRERTEDIPLLVSAFVRECCRDNGFREKTVTPAVLEQMRSYDWPGNVRELRNVVERLVIMSDDVITDRELPDYLQGARAPRTPTPAAGVAAAAGADPLGVGKLDIDELTLRGFREAAEERFLRYRLDQAGWNISRTAAALGIERTNLHKKLRSLGIHRDDGK